MPEPEDFLRAGEEALGSARILLEHRRWADSISRAYYAMVYAARALLTARGFAPRTHRGTIRLFGKELVRAGIFPADVARSLSAAMAFRGRADYGMRGDLSEHDARRTVEAAEEFLSVAKRALHAPR